MANVRFYRLGVLPSFDVSKHVGVFVHLIPTEGETHKAGLWFGGATNWEYLTNDTNAIDAAINAKIQDLDVEGYAQAEMSGDGTTLTIKGIQEVDGKIGIPNSDNLNLNIAIDGGYNKDNNKIATQSTVTNAINALDVNTVQAVTKETSGNITTLTFKGIKEVDGKIYQGDDANPSTLVVGDAKLKIQIGSAAASDVFSANATVDSTIKLDGNVFTKNGDVISVITPTAVASDNRLVTEKDVANLAGAMHYKGTVSSLTEFQNKLADSDAEEAGDVYIATGIQEGSFIHNGNTIENGDMIVFNSASEYKVVQSNITLGTGDGQIAANVGALADGNLVVGVNNPETGSKGIKTVNFDVTNLTGTTGKNERTLKIENGTPDTLVASLYHDVTITDDFTVIGKPFTKSINISSTNRSIEISKKTVGGVDTGVIVDLVWNTSIE